MFHYVETYIMNINNEFLSYFIGFLQTDGYIHRKYVSIEINDIDVHILNKFQENLGGTVRYRTRNTNFKKNSRLAAWRKGSVDFVKELNKIGLPCGKKSKSAYPITIDKDLKRHYIRGLIDGDGSLLISSDNIPMIGFTTASDKMSEFYISWLRNIGINVNIHKNKRDNIWNIAVTREKAQQVSHILYDNCLISLNRKQKKSQEITSWKRPTSLKKQICNTDRWTTSELNILGKHNLKASEIIRLNVLPERTTNAIKIKCHRLKKINLLPSRRCSS